MRRRPVAPSLLPPEDAPPGAEVAAPPAGPGAGPGAGGDDGEPAAGLDQPLAARMRPRALAELIGQDAVVGPGTVLRRALEAGALPSLVLWGPPGSGKTTLARLLAAQAGARLVALSAVESGVGALRAAVAEARALRRQGGRTVLFVDELHRWSRAQQDAALPHVESGLVTLIGATTENPSFEVVGALLSRCRVVRLRPLSAADLRTLLGRALADRQRGLGALDLEVEPGVLERLADAAGGDARVALGALELAALAAEPDPAGGPRRVTAAHADLALQRRAVRHDRAGDAHYDVISALIKSVRGSDADAALFWLARLLEAGEDVLFVARRLVILASEDVGLADPAALSVAVAAQQAAHFVGMPEAHLPLAQATIYLALAPKSNSVLTAYAAAAGDVLLHPDAEVPLHLRNAVTGLMRAEGHGAGYRYAHDFEGGVAPQSHAPAGLESRRYYEAGGLGAEPALAARWAALRDIVRAEDAGAGQRPRPG